MNNASQLGARSKLVCVKDLDGNVKLDTVKVKIHGIWVKTDLESDQIFPLQIFINGVLEWEAI